MEEKRIKNGVKQMGGWQECKRKSDKEDRQCRQIDGLLHCIDTKKNNNNQDTDMQKHLSVHMCEDTLQRINANN